MKAATTKHKLSKSVKILLLVASAILVLLGCLLAFWLNIDPKGGSLEPSYIGLTTGAARDKAHKHHEDLRVVGGAEKQQGILTADFRNDRIDVYTVFNIVIKAERY